LIGKSPSAAELRAELRTVVGHAPHLVDAELATRLDKPLMTGDRRLSKALGLRCAITLI